RHEWLGYIERRLRVARELLAETGTLWVHLDDAEAHRVRCLLDDVMGVDAFIADLTVESNPKGRQLDRFFAGSHDRLMVYARSPESVTLAGGVAAAVDPRDFPHTDHDGVAYRLLPLRNTNKRFNPATAPTMTYPLYGDPGTGVVSLEPVPGAVEIHPVFGDLTPAVWRWSRSRARDRVDELVCRTVRGRSGPRVDVYQRGRHEAGRIKKFRTVWLSREGGSTDTPRAGLRAADAGGFRPPTPAAATRRAASRSSGPCGSPGRSAPPTPRGPSCVPRTSAVSAPPNRRRCCGGSSSWRPGPATSWWTCSPGPGPRPWPPAGSADGGWW